MLSGSGQTTTDDAEAGVHCPLCEYDLRGLTEPRCPECGYRFTWDEIRDPARRLHPYLFEHHPERNVWSFIRTLTGGLRPRRFWSQLTPTTPSSPRRLVTYWLIVMGLAVLPYLLALGATALEVQSSNRKFRALQTKYRATPAGASAIEKAHAATGRTFEQDLDEMMPLFPSRGFFRQIFLAPFPKTILFALTLAALWPWTTVLGMRLLLWISMRRARVRMFHVARCAIHASDVVVWHWLATSLVSIYVLTLVMRGGGIFVNATTGSFVETLLFGTLVMFGLVSLATGYRLIVAFDKYLRVPHAWAVVPLTQVIILIATLSLTGLITSAIR